jgi:hypothetical protein
VSSPQRKLRLLSTLHIFGVLGIVVWWSFYWWRDSPATKVQPRSLSDDTSFSLPLDHLELVIKLAMGDLACGATVIVLLAVGTGAYVS